MTFEEGINKLTYAFLEILDLAENYFGNRDKNWTFIGLEFFENGPYIKYYPNNRISIVLSKDCSRTFPDCPQLYFQLAHETCHLLYPTGKADANILIEGISTYFSKIYQEMKYPNSTYAIDSIKKSKYFEAYQIIEKLLINDPYVIRNIRQKGIDLTNISENELKCLDIGLNDEEIKILTDKFL